MKKWNLFFRLFLSRLQPCLFLPRPNYYFFSVFCPETFQNLLFSGRNQLFLVFPREGRTIISSLRLGFVIPREGKHPCCPKALPLLSLGIIFVLRGSLSWLVAPQDKNYPLGQQGQGLGTTRIRSLPRDDKALPEGWKNSSTLPREDKKKLVSSRKKKILKHFWAENTEKIVIWPWQEKVRLQPWQKKSEK